MSGVRGLVRRLLCRLGFHGPIAYVEFVYASYTECESCGRRQP